MKSRFAIIIFAAALSLSAQLTIVNAPLPLDGKLTGNGWENVPEQTGFHVVRATGRTKPDAETSFRAAADADNLYFSILCRENRMEKLLKADSMSRIWVSDSVQVFFCPTGQSDEFYQFAVSAGKVRYSMFYGEAGVIQPDPYQPDWESKVFYGKDYWLVQLRIPFSSLYMTRNTKWSPDWLLNVARKRTPVPEATSWSRLLTSFLEPRNFRKFKGFPMRKPAQDLAILKAKPSIESFSDGVYSGPLELTVEANPAAAGNYELSVKEPNGKSSTHAVTLKKGMNRIVLPKTEYLRKAQGKTNLGLALKSLKTGTVFSRSYPVDIVYEPARFVLESPCYKRCFFPGQDHSKIAGKLHLSLSDAQKKSASIELTLSGDGLKEKTQKFKAKPEVIPFKFDSSALTVGGKATLRVKLLDGGKEIACVSQTVRRLKKNAGSMFWIKDGVLYKNGKPCFFRTMSAVGWHGGKAFDERLKKDDLCFLHPKVVNVEPKRLVPGIEPKEATKDVKPCPEVFEKIRKIVEECRDNPDVDIYYLADEPECRNISPVYLKYVYDFISELDPYHPVISCSRNADRFIDTADIMRTHPYINPTVSGGKRFLQIPIDRVRNYLQDVTKFKRPDKIAGFTGQFFSYKFNNFAADYPTWEEMESMSWSGLAQGARHFQPYAYHDLGDRPRIYEATRYFNQSIKALEKQLLSNRKYPVKTVDPENMLDTLLVEGDGVTLLVAVNLKNGPLEATVSAEHLKKFKSLQEFRGNGSRKVVNGELKLSLKPYECVVLTSKKMDTGLPTRDQVLKVVAEAEKARTSRGSLLFEKGDTFEIDSCNPPSARGGHGIRNKMFDGVTDVFAWESKRGAEERWFELNFREKPPKFSKIGIYGHNIDRPTVKIWKLGKWETPTPKKIDKTKYSAVLDFGEELKSAKIRIDFDVKSRRDQVELYEIELLGSNAHEPMEHGSAARSPNNSDKTTGQQADNTLWEEDGKNLAIGQKAGLNVWCPERNKKKLEIKSKEDGKGFSFYAADSNGRKATTRIKYSPEYPYLVFRVTDFELFKGYRNWTIRTEIGNMIVSQVNAIQKGIFVFDLYQNLPGGTSPKNPGSLNVWIYNLRLDLEYMKLVKKPDYVVRAECADPEIKQGSMVKFTAELPEEAEDVSISLTTMGVPRPVKVNGAVKIQLKPTDKTQKVWTAEIEVKSIGIEKELRRHQLFMKMDVLGGGLNEPVWVGLPYAVAP